MTRCRSCPSRAVPGWRGPRRRGRGPGEWQPPGRSRRSPRSGSPCRWPTRGARRSSRSRATRHEPSRVDAVVGDPAADLHERLLLRLVGDVREREDRGGSRTAPRCCHAVSSNQPPTWSIACTLPRDAPVAGSRTSAPSRTRFSCGGNRYRWMSERFCVPTTLSYVTLAIASRSSSSSSTVICWTAKKRHQVAFASRRCQSMSCARSHVACCSSFRSPRSSGMPASSRWTSASTAACCSVSSGDAFASLGSGRGTSMPTAMRSERRASSQSRSSRLDTQSSWL